MFTDRVAIVTGGASGIGHAIVTKLVENGAKVAVWDINEERLSACKARFGDKVLVQKVDVSIAAEVDGAMADVVERWGAPGHLVNNAGIIGRRMSIAEFDEGEFDRVMAINVKSVFLATRAFVRNSQGIAGRTIVNMSSIAKRTGGMAGNMIYAMTKGAIQTMTISFAKELGPEVRVNALSPGIIDTEIQASVFANKADMAKFLPQIFLRRVGGPEEVADAALWLLSPKSSYITGVTIDVSGGR